MNTKALIFPFLVSTLLLVLVGCDSEPSVASRSNEAYREAVARGENVAGGHEHGGHVAARGASGMPAEEHHSGTTEAEAEAAHGDMHSLEPGQPGSAHAAPGQAHSMTSSPTATAHAGHRTAPGATPALSTHAGHAMPRAQQPDSTSALPSAHAEHAMPQAQPTASMPSPGHEMHVTAPPLATVAPAAPRTSSEIAGISPAATLGPDPLDSPVSTSVAEAEKAARASETGHAAHGSDAPSASPAPPPSDHGAHTPPPPKKD